jgi:hypothetical protein
MTKVKKNYNSFIIGGVILVGIVVMMYFYNNNKKDQKQMDRQTQSPTSSPSKPPSDELKNVMYKINKATDELKNVPNEIKSTYGKMDRFYVTGKADLPESGLTLIKKVDKITSIKDVINENMPLDATLFSYDPIKSSVSYYKGDISLSLIKQGNLTIGSIIP